MCGELRIPCCDPVAVFDIVAEVSVRCGLTTQFVVLCSKIVVRPSGVLLERVFYAKKQRCVIPIVLRCKPCDIRVSLCRCSTIVLRF